MVHEDVLVERLSGLASTDCISTAQASVCTHRDMLPLKTILLSSQVIDRKSILHLVANVEQCSRLSKRQPRTCAATNFVHPSPSEGRIATHRYRCLLGTNLSSNLLMVIGLLAMVSESTGNW